jgi:hypothetical protein
MTLLDDIHQYLAQHGPSAEADIHAALHAAGRTTAKTPQSVVRLLTETRAAERLLDGRWDLVSRRLAGCVFTTRARAVVRDHTLWVHRDLEPLDSVHPTVLGGFALASGGTATWRGTAVRSLVGPPGWLPAVTPGRLLALRWDGHALAVSAVDDEPAMDSAPVRHLRALLGLHARHRQQRYYGQPAPDLSQVVLSALREDPDLLRQPMPPLSELLPLPDTELDSHELWAGDQREAVTLRLPLRTVEELTRRAELIGDRAADYASMLLTATVDRVRAPEHPVPAWYAWEGGWDDRYDGGSGRRYDPVLDDDRVEPLENAEPQPVPQPVVTPLRRRS